MNLKSHNSYKSNPNILLEYIEQCIEHLVHYYGIDNTVDYDAKTYYSLQTTTKPQQNIAQIYYL